MPTRIFAAPSIDIQECVLAERTHGTLSPLISTSSSHISTSILLDKLISQPVFVSDPASWWALDSMPVKVQRAF